MKNNFISSYKNLSILFILAFVFQKIGSTLFFYFFIFLINLLWLPQKIKNNCSFKENLFLIITIFFISAGVIFYFEGISKLLFSYFMISQNSITLFPKLIPLLLFFNLYRLCFFLSGFFLAILPKLEPAFAYIIVRVL